MIGLAKPDFLVIGAQKAGTTWLYSQLQRHPDIWLPPVKEIHYFDRGRRPLALDAIGGKHRRALLWRWLKPALADGNRTDLMWHARFFLSPRSEEWYDKCFNGPPGKLAGDITPAYARLDNAAITRAALLLPDAQIIYILRDPIERMWSQAAMYFSRYGHIGLAQQSERDIRKFLKWDLARANSDYIANIDRWQRHFPNQQFHIKFFDSLESNPGEFLGEVCSILNVAPPSPDPAIADKVHARSYPEIPAALLVDLKSEYLPMIQELDKRFATHETAMWLERAQTPVR